MIIPHSRRAVAATFFQKAFWIYGGMGIKGTIAIDDIGKDLWKYDGQWQLICDNGPYPARFPGLCASTDAIYMFGGCSEHNKKIIFCNDLFFFRQNWQKINPKSKDIPLGRYTNAMVCYQNQLIIFGGYSECNGEKIFLGDLWKFDLHTNTWYIIHDSSIGPGKRYGFGWCYDKDHLYIFGGFDGKKDCCDLWSLSLLDYKWKLLASGGPQPRYCPCLGMIDKNLLLFGGRSKVRSKDNFSDTWLFNQQWQLVKKLPAPDYHAKSACATNGEKMWIFGGEARNGHISDLWRFDNNGWQCLHGPRLDDPILW